MKRFSEFLEAIENFIYAPKLALMALGREEVRGQMLLLLLLLLLLPLPLPLMPLPLMPLMPLPLLPLLRLPLQYID